MALNHEVEVVHPTFNGSRLVRWKVIIHYIEVRETVRIGDQNESGKVSNRVTFRGSSSTGSWIGNKTFFADQYSEMLDLGNGKVYKSEADITSRLSEIVLQQKWQKNEQERIRL